MMYSISIVTPVFNSMRTLKEYLDALLFQDYPHELLEIIIADGGSKDGTLEELEKYKKKADIPIKVYDKAGKKRCGIAP